VGLLEGENLALMLLVCNVEAAADCVCLAGFGEGFGLFAIEVAVQAGLVLLQLLRSAEP